MVDLEKLRAGLEKLTGLDYTQIYQETKRPGEVMILPTFEPAFLEKLAGRALGVNPHDIKELPIKEYNRVLTETRNFFTESAED